ncbi:MAG: cell division protein CrgA [Microthrixaceae bacterium]|nr:cell division protein CrgA [Microthrixaceae bacterium]
MAGGDPDTTETNKPLPPAAKRKKPAGARAKGDSSAGGAGRYTAPVPASKKGPSPRWVPVLMFALWGIGLGMILLNYMGLLPGSADGGNGWYLIGGLGLILGGIITATQYR